MRCPSCQHTENRVLESRSADSGSSVRRRRECLKCNNRFTTYERVEAVPINVIKRDESREPFDRAKLLRGITRACEKTGVAAAAIENLVEQIEAELQQRSTRDVSTHEIGELVLHHLQSVSEVAYIRFASVYRQFRGIRDFVDTLDHLQSHTVSEDSQNQAGNGATSPQQLLSQEAIRQGGGGISAAQP